MAQSREQQKAMFAKMGIGAKVELTKKFGIGDIPVGTEGTVDGHIFGKDQPSVKFPQGRFIVDAEKLKVLKGSRKFVPRNVTQIVAKGTKEELLKKLKESGEFFNITPDGFFTGVIHLDDGEGRTANVSFSGEVKNDGAEIKLNKNDVPSRWRFLFDDITDDAENKVAFALGVEEP